jgi:xanthine dehydrogenase accessory factor
MQELLDTLDGWRTEGAGVGRAVLVRAFGSAPRPEGAVLLATDDGRLVGSVSGGCVEGAAVEEILAARKAGRERVIRYGISDEQAWDVGLACGGTIDVLISPTVPDAAIEAARATRGGRGGRGRAGVGREAGRVVVTPLPADAPPPAFRAHARGEGSEPAEPLVVHEDGRLEGSLGNVALDEALVAAARDALARGVSGICVLGGHQLFIEAYPVRPRLVVMGAVEVARSLVRLASELGYETVVLDGRAAFATPERFPDVDELIVGWPDEVADEIGLGPSDAVAVLTHDAKFDEPAIIVALARGCRYVGAIGSRSTQAARRARLLAAGVKPGDVERLRGPIGLDLGGRLPSETALAIMAEVVAERRAGTGQPLRDLVRLEAASRAPEAAARTAEAASRPAEADAASCAPAAPG